MKIEPLDQISIRETVADRSIICIHTYRGQFARLKIYVIINIAVLLQLILCTS